MVADPGDRLDRRRLLVVAAACLAGVFVLDAWLHLVGPLPGERAVGRWWTHWSPIRAGADVNAAFTFFDVLATPWIAAATVAAAAAVVWENDGPRWSLMAAAASGVVVLNATLKHLLGPTPLWDELRSYGLNFPSGHVAYATAFFGMLALVCWRHRQRALTVVCVALVPLMVIDRVVAGAHLPSDTIGGFLVGSAWLLGVIALLGPPDALQRLRPTG